MGIFGARYALAAKHRDCRLIPLATALFLNLRVALALREPHVLRIDTIGAERVRLYENCWGARPPMCPGQGFDRVVTP